jgi:chitinase
MANLKFFIFEILLIASATAYVPKNVIYWGQESNGKESSLATYCNSGSYDVIVLAFVYMFPTDGSSQYPGMNFAGHCGTSYNKANPELLICPTIEADIKTCQARGVQILLSFGGAEGTYGFSDNSQASAFADTVWNMFLGGNGSIRPFGTAILDGVDLDIESGSTTGYVAFIQQLRTHFATAPKNYYISSAPQCPFPDDLLGPGSGTALQTAWFDYVWVQFYNNNCGLNHYSKGAFNFATWGNWAQKTSLNPNVKVFIGAPASSQAAGEGYVPLATLQTITASVLSSSYANVFGGIMLWDTSNSDLNGNFGGSIASYLHAMDIAGGSPVTTGPKSTTTTTTTTTSTTGTTTTSTTGVHSTTTTTTSTSHKSSHSGHATTTTTTTTSTTGSSTTGSGTTGTSTTGSSTTGSSTTGPTNPTSPPSGSCGTGYMMCLTSETYSMCAHNAWGVSQPCPAGTVCAPSGNYIYCQRA